MLEYNDGCKILFSLRQKVFIKFLAAREDFFQDNPAGNTINDTTTELERASDAIIGSIEMLGLSIIFTAYITMMLYLSTFLLYLRLYLFYFLFFSKKRILTKSKEVGRSIAFNNRLFVSHLGQRFTNSRLLKLTADENLEANKMKKIIKTQRNDRIKSGILVAITNSAVEPIILLTGVIVLSGAILVFEQNLANLGVFTLILIRGVPLVRNIFAQLQKLEVNWYALKAVIDTFERLDSIKN